jgi:hypothetical protein
VKELSLRFAAVFEVWAAIEPDPPFALKFTDLPRTDSTKTIEFTGICVEVEIAILSSSNPAPPLNSTFENSIDPLAKILRYA